MEKIHTVLIFGSEYKTKFKVGDRVKSSTYGGDLILDEIDALLTEALNKLHWRTTSVDYILGKVKTNNGEPVCDNEIRICK